MIARIGAHRIAFPATDVAAVLPVPPLWRPPTSPRLIAGFLPRAGAVLPVLNAALLLGLPTPARFDFYAHILVLPGAGQGAGLLVDRAEEAVTIGGESIIALDAADTLNGCAIALARTGEGQVHMLSAARLLAVAEAAALADLSQEAGRRLADWQVSA